MKHVASLYSCLVHIAMFNDTKTNRKALTRTKQEAKNIKTTASMVCHPICTNTSGEGNRWAEIALSGEYATARQLDNHCHIHSTYFCSIVCLLFVLNYHHVQDGK